MGTKLKVLLIEDTESDAALNIQTLESAGYQVTSEIVTTASEMRAALEKTDFDLVLSDHNLPQFDSSAALAIFKERKQDKPFIIVSGTIGEETAVALMKAGAQDYIMKSNLAKLVPAVERELKDAVTRRLQQDTENRLRISEERFCQVADIAGEMIWEIDADLKYIYVNHVAKSVTGYSPDELVGKKTIFDLFPTEIRQVYQESLTEYFQQHKTFREFTSPRLKKDGQIVILETSAAPKLGGDGELLGYRGTDIDVTGRKQMEVKINELYNQEKEQRQQLQEESEVKNLFINVLAHELRNPLTAVIVSSEMLKDVPDLKDELKIKLATNIYTSANMVTKRLDELLDMARFSKGTFQLNRNNVDAPEFISQMAERFTPALEKRSQRLIIEIRPELHNINIDSSRIEQVLINLLSNASKYSPEHSEILLKAGLRDSEVYFEVIDRGTGISIEDQHNLFRPYYRASKHQNVPGMGLGLAISNKIIEAHGGRIAVSSKPGEGSTFSVLIPV
jgi:PAS domain S-box-containing protein